MVKKFTLFFLMGIFGLFTTNLFAQEDATIDPSEIVYWIGEGENEVVFIVNWNEPNIALAWGYRFNEENVTVKTVMDDITETDGRFSYEVGDWGVTDIKFDEDDTHYALVGSYWWFNINGSGAMAGYDQQTVVNGDFVKWGDISCATEVGEYVYVWEQPVQPVTVWDAVGEIEFSTLSVYPNPASAGAFVILENSGLNKISVYDMTGRVVNETSVESAAGESVQIDTEMLSGVYFVTVDNGNAHYRAKLVVK